MRRDLEEWSLLYIDHTESIAAATGNHKLRGELIHLGCDELHVNLKAVERIDRLIRCAHIIRRCEPRLNFLEESAAPRPVLGFKEEGWRAAS